MTTSARPEWKHLGKTDNADFYEIEPDVIGIIPHPNTKDDATTARQSIGFQDTYWRKVGRRGAVVVFMDNVVEQDAGARAVYSDEVKDLPTTCFALVGETFYGYATATVYEGLAPPGRPTNIFRSLEDAKPWIAEMNRASGGKT